MGRCSKEKILPFCIILCARQLRKLRHLHNLRRDNLENLDIIKRDNLVQLGSSSPACASVAAAGWWLPPHPAWEGSFFYICLCCFYICLFGFFMFVIFYICLCYFLCLRFIFAVSYICFCYLLYLRFIFVVFYICRTEQTLLSSHHHHYCPHHVVVVATHFKILGTFWCQEPKKTGKWRFCGSKFLLKKQVIKDFPAGVPSPPAVLEGVEGDQAFNLDNFLTTLEQLWNKFGTTLGQLWENFETTLGQLWYNFRTISITCSRRSRSFQSCLLGAAAEQLKCKIVTTVLLVLKSVFDINCVWQAGDLRMICEIFCEH